LSNSFYLTLQRKLSKQIWNKMKDEFLEHNMVIYIHKGIKGITGDFYSE